MYTEDPYADVHPDLLLRYYGVDSLTAEGSDTDEVEEMRQTLEGEIAEDMQGNLNHEAIPVAEHHSPFASCESKNLFMQALAEVQESGLIPDHPDFLASDFHLTSYPTHEDITVGIRRSKSVTLHLPPQIWMPRAQSWAQALHLLEHFMMALD